MEKTSINTAVGIFMVIGIVCLGYLSINLGKLEFFDGDHYMVSAYFTSASGLKKGATVEIAGVEVGRVEKIKLDPNEAKARVDISLVKSVKLQDDVIASVRSRGIIGDKFVLLRPGGSEKIIPPGGAIRETESAIDLEELFSKYVHGQLE
jgi:phospholipid/cholesterol/gamma-HCH transport system substrate-binding protein